MRKVYWTVTFRDGTETWHIVWIGPNTHCSTTATMVARARLIVALHVHCVLIGFKAPPSNTKPTKARHLTLVSIKFRDPQNRMLRFSGAMTWWWPAVTSTIHSFTALNEAGIKYPHLRMAFRNCWRKERETKQYDLDHFHFAHYLSARHYSRVRAESSIF